MPTTNPATLVKHISAGKAIAIAAQIDGTVSAPQLCLSGFSYPVAIALGKMLSSGVAAVGALHRMGFSASDSTSIAAAIVAKGAH
jgi:hypothetical protein